MLECLPNTPVAAGGGRCGDPEHGLHSRAALVPVPASLLESSVTLDKLVLLSEPWFPHLENEG